MDKKNNKKLKKYKQKYTTGGRVDMSKGGRVGYQVGKTVKKSPVINEDEIIDRPSVGDRPNRFSIEREEDIAMVNRSMGRGRGRDQNDGRDQNGGGTGNGTGTGTGTDTTTNEFAGMTCLNQKEVQEQ